MKLLRSALIAGLVGFGASAHAVSWTTTGTFGLTSLYQLDSSNPSNNLKVTAYSTTTLASSGTRGATDGSSWLAAQLQGYGNPNGFGVRNALACTTTNCTGKDAGEGVSPEHAVDNDQLVDIVVFELPTIPNMTWSFSTLSIGYVSSNNDTSPEINVWVGGKDLGAGYNFSDTCFVGCTTSGDKSLTDAARGFTYAGRIDFSGTGTKGINASATAHDSGSALFDNRNASAVGQYIIIAASSTASGSSDSTKAKKLDAFKISGLTANLQSVPGQPSSGQVPEPGSLMLLGGGILGLAWFRRRQGHTC